MGFNNDEYKTQISELASAKYGAQVRESTVRLLNNIFESLSGGDVMTAAEKSLLSIRISKLGDPAHTPYGKDFRSSLVTILQDISSYVSKAETAGVSFTGDGSGAYTLRGFDAEDVTKIIYGDHEYYSDDLAVVKSDGYPELKYTRNVVSGDMINAYVGKIIVDVQGGSSAGSLNVKLSGTTIVSTSVAESDVMNLVESASIVYPAGSIQVSKENLSLALTPVSTTTYQCLFFIENSDVSSFIVQIKRQDPQYCAFVVRVGEDSEDVYYPPTISTGQSYTLEIALPRKYRDVFTYETVGSASPVISTDDDTTASIVGAGRYAARLKLSSNVAGQHYVAVTPVNIAGKSRIGVALQNCTTLDGRQNVAVYLSVGESVFVDLMPNDGFYAKYSEPSVSSTTVEATNKGIKISSLEFGDEEIIVSAAKADVELDIRTEHCSYMISTLDGTGIPSVGGDVWLTFFSDEGYDFSSGFYVVWAEDGQGYSADIVRQSENRIMRITARNLRATKYLISATATIKSETSTALLLDSEGTSILDSDSNQIICKLGE